jgi:hypothetical protein
MDDERVILLHTAPNLDSRVVRGLMKEGFAFVFG